MPDTLFTPSKIKNKAYYKEHLINEEENKDNFGNKGFFEHQKDFKLGMLFEGHDEDYLEFMKHHNLTS